MFDASTSIHASGVLRPWNVSVIRRVIGRVRGTCDNARFLGAAQRRLSSSLAPGSLAQERVDPSVPRWTYGSERQG
jgi:hypothetical protein